ncbi:MAG: hypothetical protein ABJC26_02070 [Gemmatimonadaceae bacterium]
MSSELSDYLASIGRKGGTKSRRTLTPDDAKRMVRIREARRAFRRFRARCFWSYRADLHIGADDVSWVAVQLMRNGDREAWLVGEMLCR